MSERAVDAPEVGLADIARLAGVRPTAVSNWRRRHGSFPRPIGGTERSPRFALAEVQAWLETQGRTLELPPIERAWQALDAAGRSAELVDLLVGVGLAIVGDDVVERGEAGDPFAGWRPPQARSVAAVVAELRDAAGEAEARAAFEGLCSRFLAPGARTGAGVTPPELATVMLDLAGPATGAVFDPACGAGGVLATAAATGRRPLLGQERDPALARLAAVRLAVAGHRAHITTGDSLRTRPRLPVAVTSVICHPPFAERSWGHESLVGDTRFEYGFPPRGEPELAWVQAALACLEPGGVAVVVMPPAAASRPSGRRIRRELVTRGAVAAVISLPPGLAAHYALALQLWVLRRPAGRSASTDVVMVETAEACAGVTAAEGWQRVCSLVSAAVVQVHGEPADEGVIRQVPAVEILDQDGDLAPRRYLVTAAQQTPTTEELAGRLLALADGWTSLAGTVRQLEADVMAGGDASAPELTVEELVRSGSMAIRRRAPRGEEPDSVRSAPILTAMDLAMGRDPSDSGEVDADELRNPPIRWGDVLVPTTATRLRARVATKADVGSYPGPGVAVLRPDPEVLDPWYLAGYLSSARCGRQADRVGSSLGGALRVDPRRLSVPLPPIEVQRRWGAVFEQLASAYQELHRALADGEQSLQDVVDVLASHAADGVTPPEITSHARNTRG